MRTAPPGQLPTSNLLLMVVGRSQKPRSRGGGGVVERGGGPHGNILGARIKIGVVLFISKRGLFSIAHSSLHFCF